MGKLGVCVRYDCNNYGSMLQILATQKVIEKFGWEYEIIRYDKMTLGFMVKNLSRLVNPYFMRGKLMEFTKKRKLKAYPEVERKNAIRLRLFQDYREKYIGPYSPVFKGYSNLVKGAENYDAIMVGSDQLWTPAGIKSKFYNLLFVPSHIRKISFATSFGVSQVPANQVAETTRYLNRIEYLSVREVNGAKIVSDLTNRKAMVALDPTLMFSGKDWEEIFPRAEYTDKPYIFAYFLGTNPNHRKVVEKIKKETGLKLITCPFMDEFVECDLSFGDEQRFDVGPIDFLNLIRNAEYVCTDSFHGSVFSILNHKKFITFNRFDEGEKQSRNSRIESLFSLLGLESRRYSINKTDLIDMLERPIDYMAVDESLDKLRKESYAFLAEALKND